MRLRYNLLGLDRHDGVDYEVPEGTPVLAVDAGVVIESGWGDFGKTVVIEHAWGRSIYGHLSEVHPPPGQEVQKGEIIGLSGNTGLSTGPHLHLALKLKNSPSSVDPLAYLSGNSNVLGETNSSYTTKNIIWNLNLTQGQTVLIGYTFKAPLISPRFYLLGQLQFKSEIRNPKQTIIF